MKYVRSQTDFLVSRIVVAVQLPPEHPANISTRELVALMKKKDRDGSWNP